MSAKKSVVSGKHRLRLSVSSQSILREEYSPLFAPMMFAISCVLYIIIYVFLANADSVFLPKQPAFLLCRFAEGKVVGCLSLLGLVHEG